MGYSNKNFEDEHCIISLSGDNSKHEQKIIDLDDDCLAKIFDHLNLQSLFNVALANAWLRSAANDVYTRKFNQKEVRFCIDSSQRNKRLFEKDTKIYVNGLKMCLQYLRCFGPSISDFEIFHLFLCKPIHCDYIYQYIREYCNLERLATMKLSKIRTYPMKLKKFSYQLHKCSKCCHLKSG